MTPSEIAVNPLGLFLEATKQFSSPIVLELGTRRVDPTVRTRREDWVPHAAEYIGVDFIAGEDVDVVADLHRLSSVVGEESCDVILTCSTFEHIKYPQLAAHEVMKTLRIGGLLFVHTVHTFPLHGFPHDYFRFSREGLASLFGTKMGLEIIATAYDFPAKIHSERQSELKDFEAYLNVTLFGRKVAATPAEFVYELESVEAARCESNP